MADLVPDGRPVMQPNSVLDSPSHGLRGVPRCPAAGRVERGYSDRGLCVALSLPVSGASSAGTPGVVTVEKLNAPEKALRFEIVQRFATGPRVWK
jgi:hypothetical protein